MSLLKERVVCLSLLQNETNTTGRLPFSLMSKEYEEYHFLKNVSNESLLKTIFDNYKKWSNLSKNVQVKLILDHILEFNINLAGLPVDSSFILNVFNYSQVSILLKDLSDYLNALPAEYVLGMIKEHECIFKLMIDEPPLSVQEMMVLDMGEQSVKFLYSSKYLKITKILEEKYPFKVMEYRDMNDSNKLLFLKTDINNLKYIREVSPLVVKFAMNYFSENLSNIQYNQSLFFTFGMFVSKLTNSADVLFFVKKDPNLLKQLIYNGYSNEIKIKLFEEFEGLDARYLTSGYVPELVKLAAVKSTGLNIRYFGNCSTTIKKAAVESDPKSIQYIDKPSSIIQKIAVNQDGLLIRFIKEPVDSIQLEALKQNLKSLAYITEVGPNTLKYISELNLDTIHC